MGAKQAKKGTNSVEESIAKEDLHRVKNDTRIRFNEKIGDIHDWIIFRSDLEMLFFSGDDVRAFNFYKRRFNEIETTAVRFLEDLPHSISNFTIEKLSELERALLFHYDLLIDDSVLGEQLRDLSSRTYDEENQCMYDISFDNRKEDLLLRISRGTRVS